MNDTNNGGKRQAIGAFLAKVNEFNALVEELQSAAADHFGVDPDGVNWGHVGDMAHRVETLKQITDAYYRRGEFAEKGGR